MFTDLPVLLAVQTAEPGHIKHAAYEHMHTLRRLQYDTFLCRVVAYSTL